MSERMSKEEFESDLHQIPVCDLARENIRREARRARAEEERLDRQLAKATAEIVMLRRVIEAIANGTWNNGRERPVDVRRFASEALR